MTVIGVRDPQATVAILTADHHIAYKDLFRQVLTGAHALAQRGNLVTLGISPSFPSTAFGYIRRGATLGHFEGFEGCESLGFTEKPNAQTAMQFIASGEYSWNSGMFILTFDKAMQEFERQQPEMYREFKTLRTAVDTPEFAAALGQTWERITKISLDYAIMEGARDVAVIPVDIGWSDVGSWDSLFDVLQLDEAGNGFKGNSPERIVIDTRNTLVYSDKLAVTIGVENIVVVETDDVLMVCHKERTQTIKDVVNRLKAQNYDIYL
jgi:mannose-1-phosphate guanylyltransferase